MLFSYINPDCQKSGMVCITEKEWVTKTGYKSEVEKKIEGFRVGFVGVPKSHKLHGKKYWNRIKGKRIDKIFKVHGGIEFTGHINDNDGLWYFGFHCAHKGDYSDDCDEKIKREIDALSFMEDDFQGESSLKSLEFCISECEKLAEQLKEYENVEVDPLLDGIPLEALVHAIAGSYREFYDKKKEERDIKNGQTK